ncbi:hypothetical protein GC163_21950 [bacterium]|nr:hypothetical protein [bacterium]
MSITPPPPDDRLQNLSDRMDKAPPSLVQEFLAFLAINKKWWLLPILLALLAVAVLLLVTATPLGPFLYPLF